MNLHFPLMDTKARACLPLSFLLLLLFSLNTHLSTAADTISLSQPLSRNQTIISTGGNFELGFFTPGNSHNYYIGIWYKKLPNKTIVWVANRETPISYTTSAKLTISDDGNLVLLNQSKLSVWSSNSAPIPSNTAVAVLLDTGNLVLRNGSDSSTDIWQSFAHPTDTWMPGGWLGVDKITGEYQSLTSWKNSNDPAPGPFAQSMDHDGSNQYVLIWNESQIYWSSGLWTGKYFSNVPGTNEQTVFNFTFVDNKLRKFATYTITVSTVITRYVVDSSGQGRQWLWMENSQAWSPIFTQPLDHCDVFSLCGPFGICDQKSTSLCRCPDGYQPASVDWNSGCSRKHLLQCGGNSSVEEQDGFLEMPNLRLPVNSHKKSMANSTGECKSVCLSNCSCIAYAYESGCSVWIGDLRNLQQLYDGDTGGGTLFLRLAASDLPSSTNSRKMVVVITVSTIAALLMICCVLFALTWACRRRKQSRMMKQNEGSLIMFTYSDLQRMTKNFSDLLGAGGFGPVFSGTMPDSTLIAVKKLEGFSQGEKQFRAEVTTLGTVQHVNLVRLRGFCIERSRKLLVYEYMAGGSLARHLFQNDGAAKVLDWRIRFQIVLGTARGLAYLHEQCRECIIHCDIKPDNILLNEDLYPKVADFGMAKLIGRDISRVLTTMRGTIGYLAPEWISGLPITPKVDVYSFGMMLFELVSSKRNTKHSEDGDDSNIFFPSWAAKKIIEGDMLSLLDPKLEGMVDIEELERVCKVACWCIQDSEDHRPSMGQVVQILEGALEVNKPPLPKSLGHFMDDKDPIIYYQPPQESKDPLDTSQGSDYFQSTTISSVSSSFYKR